ncbi:hypothetical protein BCR39DRAFT_506029 [Naematelia encephala]|uniref:Uncharacterized protein n=1 Tax=Naematelia encephala TaxID=71784 RepID=A0A1Y2AZN2_9TREE|nr:hypothetical protein BCR39DRAFT_506029 [Naematelia encephala]
MALLLGTFLLFQLWRYVQVKKTEDIRIPKRKWIAFVQVLLGLLVFMLSCGDIIVWIIARNRHQDLNPDVLGYFMIIFGILLSAIWIFTVPAAYAYRWPTVQVQYQDPTTKQTTSEWKLRKLTSWDRLFGRSV